MNLFIIAGFLGGWEILVVIFAILLLFGGRKIPELMKGLGKGIKEFKSGMKDEDDDKSTSSNNHDEIESPKG